MATVIRVMLSRDGSEIARGTLALTVGQDLPGEAATGGPSHLSGQTQPLGLLRVDQGEIPDGPVLSMRFPSGREYQCRSLGLSGSPNTYRVRLFGSIDDEL
jgi:hypothetical protein